MSRQDKATTERNAKTLRELIKRPENKVCADCKRNDPRWASWNLGVFVCIRCSGIHRSMGTHISKVKSVDLDMWTPDQMKNVQNWGNERANLYWEAHLKAGHVPPDHKMESFIRSKYELKRWAMEGPPPADPSVLDGGAAAPAPQEPEAVAPPPPPQAPAVSPTPTGAAAGTAASSRRPQRSLLSANTFTPPSATPSAATAPAPTPVASASADLFSLDFTPPTTSHAHSPSLSSSAQPQQPRKDLKNDILSLYSSAPAPAPVAAANPQQQAFASPTAPTSFMGTGGTGLWGASSGWSAPSPAPAPSNGLSGWDTSAPAGGFGNANAWSSPAVPAAAPNPASIWGAAPAAQPATMSAFDMFAMGGGGTSTGAGAGTGAGGAAAKKDDVFGDIWK